MPTQPYPALNKEGLESQIVHQERLQLLQL